MLACSNCYSVKLVNDSEVNLGAHHVVNYVLASVAERACLNRLHTHAAER